MAARPREPTADTNRRGDPQPEALAGLPAPRNEDRRLDQLIVSALAAAALVGMSAAARLRLLAPPWGDEPHYLVLSIALGRYRTADPTLVYNNGDYWSFYPAPLVPHMHVAPNGEPVPLHNLGGPLLWALPYVWAGRTGALAFTVGASVLVVANIFWLLRQLGIVRTYAAGVTALFAIGSPVYVYATMSFVEPIGALLVIHAARQLLRSPRSPVRLALASAGLGYLPFINGRFALLTVIFGALLAARMVVEVGTRSIVPYVAALGPLLVITGLVELFNLTRYGTLHPAPGNASQGDGLFNYPVLPGLLGLGFDRFYGLFTYFPLLLLAVPGILITLRRGLGWVHLTLLLPTIAYAVVLAASYGWWGGYAPPARLLAVVAPLLAYYVAATLQRLNSWAANALAIGLAFGSLMVSVAGDLVPSQRFDSGRLSGALLMDKVADLFGLGPAARYFPDVASQPAFGNFAGHAGTAAWLRWPAATAAAALLVYLLARFRPADRTPVPPLPSPLSPPWRWRRTNFLPVSRGVQRS